MEVLMMAKQFNHGDKVEVRAQGVWLGRHEYLCQDPDRPKFHYVKAPSGSVLRVSDAAIRSDVPNVVVSVYIDRDNNLIAADVRTTGNNPRFLSPSGELKPALLDNALVVRKSVRVTREEGEE